MIPDNIKKAPFKARRACVVGKGPSIVEWVNVDADLFISCNDAIYEVDRGIVTRYDTNKPDFRFCDDLPSYVTPVVPRHCRNEYDRGYWFSWNNIGMDSYLPTACIAIYLASYFGAQEIVLCGIDALLTGNRSYYPGTANANNLGIRDQSEDFKRVDGRIIQKCRHYEGTPLAKTLYDRS